MSREIKFRAWDGTKYITFDNHQYDLIYNDISGWNVKPNLPEYKGEWMCGESQSKTPNFSLEQFTGLPDTNGVDIYDGDILDNGVAVIYSTEQACYFAGGVPLCMSNSHRSVIGNIHQNPELL